MNRFLQFLIFLAGLLTACWIATHYVASNPLALAVTALIVVVYLVGALELYRYQQSTAMLVRALDGLAEPPEDLNVWLQAVPAGLRTPVSQRIQGGRASLPRPGLAPYLVGLLVLLGMLGTFLGMIATLRGTGLALESSTDLAAIRASLAAPVQGLGFAFGTSVAGVATSAMLGLLSALCVRDRSRAVQMLDGQTDSVLRVFSPVQQRESGIKLMAQQTASLTEVADKLQAMMASMAKQHEGLSEKLEARQEQFQAKTEAVYQRLADSVEQSLKNSIHEGVRSTGAVVQPLVEATMAGLRKDTTVLHEAISQTTQQQLDGMTQAFEQGSARMLEGVSARLDETIKRLTGTLDVTTQNLSGTLDATARHLSGTLDATVQNLSGTLDVTTKHLSGAWNDVLSAQQESSKQLAANNQQALTAAVSALEQQAAALVESVSQSHQALQAELAGHDEKRLQIWTNTLSETSSRLHQQWEASGAQARQLWEEASVQARQQWEGASAQTHQKWEEISTQMRQHWEEAGVRSKEQYQEVCSALAQTAGTISAQTKADAESTMSEIARLAQQAGEVPKAAAGLVAEVRQIFSDSMARDNAMLDERNRLLETSASLLDAMKHASTEQRAAIDALLVKSAEVLERVGAQFTEQARQESEKLTGAALQITGSAVEVASLGEAFGSAVQQFGESNAVLVEHLQRIETALDKSMTRSDEQLAYYVAQAKEVIDLSIMSQKQIIEELQLAAGQNPSTGVSST